MRRRNDAGDGDGDGDGAGDWRPEDDPAEPSCSLEGGGDSPVPMQASSGDSLWQWRSQGLSEVVFSWSVDQILNKDLLRDKVRILTSFTPSLSIHYLAIWCGLRMIRVDLKKRATFDNPISTTYPGFLVYFLPLCSLFGYLPCA